MSDQYAVMGNPIAHSKSPNIHRLFAEQTHQKLNYDAMLVPEEGFVAAVAEFRAQGGKGLNITVPFKQQAWDLGTERSERAELAGAINTLIFSDDGKAYGENTDGVGLVRDLTVNHHIELAGKRILVLGAGGAVRGVLAPLLEQSPVSIVIANRTATKAQELAQVFASKGAVSGCGYDGLAGQRFDVVINGTAASLQGDVPPLPEDCLAPQACCYDMMYSAEATAFQSWATAHGAAKSVDGLGMLVEQAAESFFLWRGVRPSTVEVIAALRSA